jgi:hypothetical protein
MKPTDNQNTPVSTIRGDHNIGYGGDHNHSGRKREPRPPACDDQRSKDQDPQARQRLVVNSACMLPKFPRVANGCQRKVVRRARVKATKMYRC